MAITPSLKGKKLEVIQNDDLDSDGLKSQILVAGDDEKSRKLNRKSRRNRKNKLSNAGDSELSQTDPDSDFKESNSEERTIRSSHKEAKTTRTKKNKLSNAGDSEISQTDPDSDFRESNSEGRNTRSGQKQAKKARTKKTKLSNAGDSEISQTDPDSDFKESNSEGRNTRSSFKQAKKTRTKRNQSSDQESSGNYLTADFKDDVTPVRRNTKGRPKKSKKVKKVKKAKKSQSSDQESLGSCPTDPDSDFKDNKAGGTSTRGSTKKVKKTKKVNPSFEGSTVDLQQSAFDDLSSDNELSSKTDSSDHLDKPKRSSSRNKISTVNLIAIDSDLKENKFPSGSKVTLRSKKSKRSKKNSATKNVPSKSPSPVSNASFAVDRRSATAQFTKAKLKREGTFEIQPENISKALRDASVLFNNSIISVGKSSQGTSSSRSVSFNYTRQLSASDLDRCADEKKSLVKQKPQHKVSTLNLLTVEQPKSARKLWADSKFDPRSVYSPKPGVLDISAIKSSLKTPKPVQIAAGVRFEFSTPPRASTPIGSIKRTPYRKDQVPLLKGVLTNEKRSTNKSINKSSLKPAPNYSLGPEPLDFTEQKPASRVQSVGVRFEFSTPPTSSTPIQSVKKTPFPKESLPKEASTNEKAAANKSANTSSRVKPPPNFSKIHERQYQKMENIIELQERRAARAQLLLSGCKPLDNFAAANKSGKETTAKRPLFSPNKSAKMSKLGSSTKAGQKLSKPIQKMLKKRTSLEKKKASSKLPVKTKSKPSPVKVSKPVPVKSKPLPVKVSKPVPVRSKPSPVKVSKLVSVKTNPLKPETRACATASKYGFNMPHTTKTPVDMSTKKREEVSKYRVNRRFELLMKMREKGK